MSLEATLGTQAASGTSTAPSHLVLPAHTQGAAAPGPSWPSTVANSQEALPDPKPATRPPSISAAPPRRRRARIPGWLSARAGFRPAAGIVQDVRARAPWYRSDWADAWNYRVVPATCLIFFANVLPGIAFSLDLIETTGKYGVAEVLMSSFMAAAVFSLFGAQPLCIAGVTGPITVLNKTIYDITQRGTNPPDYLHFVGWVYCWGAILHWITAVLNWCNFLKFVTLFSCDTFGFYVSWVYLQYGVQVVTRQFPSSASPSSSASAFVGLILALLMLGTSVFLQSLAQSTLFHRHVRRVLADYGMPLALVACSAAAYWGRFDAAHPATLPTGGAFDAAGGRGRAWLVRFWQLDAQWVGVAFPFGVVLWVLFFFDHNVSSLMAQGAQFPLRKPPGFHWDFVLLGATTLGAGLLGVPAPNGLIPQAPIHTTALLVMRRPDAQRARDEEARDPAPAPAPGARLAGSSAGHGHGSIRSRHSADNADEEESKNPASRADSVVRGAVSPLPEQEVPVAVVEQRVSNLAQGALCLVLLSGPFQHVLGLIPRGVLAGLFWYMGLDALRGNGITQKLLYFARDRARTPAPEPLRHVRTSRIALFVGVQLVGFGAAFAITQTIAAIGFPVVIFLLVPVRMWLVPRLPFTAEELAILDGPTASPFTMESVGGSL